MTDFNKQVVRSLSVTICAQALKFLIGLGVTMVMARLLTPKDYGLVGMVGVVTGFVAVFRDGGLSVATIQKAEITEAQLSTLFWINVALGFVTALVVMLLSPFVAWFYNDSALVWIVVALAVPFILSGITAQPQALLQRQMQFKTIAYIEITSLIVSASVGICAAAAGWGSWALVAMTITLAVVNTFLVFFFCRWRPARPVRGSGVRSMLKFGGALTANKFFDSLACSTDILLLGKFFTAEMVGFYTRAQTLMLQPMTQLMPPLLSVALPVMSRLAETPENLKKVFLDLLQMTSFASSFITIFIVVGADWLISVFLGPQWAEAADVLQLLAGPALFIPLSVLFVLYLTAQGGGAALIRWGAVKNIITIFAILAGITWGAKGVAGSLSIATVFILLPILINITAKLGPANLRELWGVTRPGLGSCTFGGVFLYFILHKFEPESPLVGLLLLFLLNSILHGLIMGALPSCRKTLTRTISVISSSRVS